MYHLHKKFFSFSLIFILSVTALSFYIQNNSFPIYAQNLTKNDFNIITTADVGCSIRAQENIKNIEKLHPELFLVAGDLSYEKTPDCWFNMTKSLDSKTKVTIGNHDDYEEEGVIGENFKKEVLDHYNLNNSYYSFDYKNVHVLALDTQLELSVDTLEALAITNETSTDKQEKKNVDEDKKDKTIEKIEPLNERYPIVNLDDFLKQNSIDVQVPKLEKLIKSNAKVPAIDVDENQYRFVLEDLEKASRNKNIDWIIVLFHKPMYSSISKQFEEYIIRDKYQNIFDKYNVDLVIQGHNHIYARTFPLSLNPSNIAEPIVDKISDNMNNNNTSFTNPNGTIFLVVGIGGGELHRIVEEPYYVANQYNKGFGFVDLKIDGKRLDGTFYDINLNCNIKTTEKKGREFLDLESCVPTPIDQNKLKVIDHFAIIK